MPAHMRPRVKVVPASSGVLPLSTLFVYAMTRPMADSSPAYVASWMSKARHAAPTDLAAQSVTRAGSARITPIGCCPLPCGRSSVAPVEVAPPEQVEVAVFVLDAEVELEEVLHDLRRGIPLRARVIRECQHDEVRRGGLERTVLGVLRHEPYEPRMERQATLVVLEAELGRAGLASDLDRKVDQVVGVPDDHDVSSRQTHGAQDALADIESSDQLWLERLHDRTVRPDDVVDQLRLVQLSAVRQGGIGVDQLDRGDHVVALTDASLVRLAGEDRRTERVLLPLVRRDDAGDLSGQVDARGPPEPVLASPGAESVDTKLAGHLEEERVAGVAEAAIDVAEAEAAAIPVVEPCLADPQVGPRDDLRRRRDLVVTQCAGPSHELVRRTRRVMRLDRVVEQGLVRILEELLVGLVADPAGEQVVVVRRQADQCEYLAGLRVHRDDHAPLHADLLHAPLKRLLGISLCLGIDGQPQRRPRHRVLDGLKDLGPSSAGIPLDALGAVRATQLRLVGGFDAHLADKVVRLVPQLA